MIHPPWFDIKDTTYNDKRNDFNADIYGMFISQLVRCTREDNTSQWCSCLGNMYNLDLRFPYSAIIILFTNFKSMFRNYFVIHLGETSGMLNSFPILDLSIELSQ